MVRPGRVERPTSSLGVRCSIHLSYGRESFILFYSNNLQRHDIFLKTQKQVWGPFGGTLLPLNGPRLGFCGRLNDRNFDVTTKIHFSTKSFNFL